MSMFTDKSTRDKIESIHVDSRHHAALIQNAMAKGQHRRTGVRLRGTGRTAFQGTRTEEQAMSSETIEIIETKAVPLFQSKPASSIKDWREDLATIEIGPGRCGYSRLVREAEQHQCPNCKSFTSTKQMHVPNCASWGNDYTCECGAYYSGDEAFTQEDLDAGCVVWQGILDQYTPEYLAQGRLDFAAWMHAMAPIDAEPIHTSSGDWLRGLMLADGTRIMRDGIED